MGFVSGSLKIYVDAAQIFWRIWRVDLGCILDWFVVGFGVI